jgi:hypothetical protein
MRNVSAMSLKKSLGWFTTTATPDGKATTSSVQMFRKSYFHQIAQKLPLPFSPHYKSLLSSSNISAPLKDCSSGLMDALVLARSRKALNSAVS